MDNKELAIRILYALQFQDQYVYCGEVSLLGLTKSRIYSLDEIRRVVEKKPEALSRVTIDGFFNLRSLAVAINDAI